MWFLLACTPSVVESSPAPPLEVAWSKQRSAFTEISPGGRAWRRGIIHLHSHYSHDACDGAPMPGGVPDENCLQDLRNGLCQSAMDFAFITDHPSYAAEQSYADLLLNRGDDTVVEGIANAIDCGDGHVVLTMPGIEDELMPVGLERQVSEDAAENDRIYNNSDTEAITADIAAGAIVLQAHTESKSEEDLLARQAAGLSGVELFNLHAMLDPDIRKESLGLDPMGYLSAIAPFLADDADAVPDLGFLAIYQEQSVSIHKWLMLSANAPVTATAGTDAHQNVLPGPLSDGERFDSYRRMMSLFSNVLLVEGDGPQHYKAALKAGRNFVIFEVLGTPTGLEVSYGGQEAGGAGPTGQVFHVTCPTLAPTSPQMGEAPEISVTLYKGEEIYQQGCGDYTLNEPGLYRVRIDIVPHHLLSFLGSQSQYADQSFPWIYSNIFRVGG